MERIFIAINFPTEIKKKLAKLQDELSHYLPDIRWVNLENLHLTLAFLGRIPNPEPLIEITREAVEEIECFSLALRGLGAFPQPRQARVLWIGVFGGSILKLLNQVLFRKLTAAGFVLDERAFTPHITLGRVSVKSGQKPSKETVAFVLDKFKEINFGEIEVKSIEVMESTVKRSGPIYRVVEEIKLKSQN